MSVKESFQQAQAEYENVVFVFNFVENGYEFNDVDEAGECFNVCAELVSDNSSACEPRPGYCDVHIEHDL